MEQTSETELVKVVKELEFRTTITIAMLSTLDLEQILYVILSGITSGDGLGFNRAFLFLDDEAGRALHVTIALGPSDEQTAQEIWQGINQDRLNLAALLPRFEQYRKQRGAERLTQRMSSFSLPLDRLESLAVPPRSLVVGKRSPLVGVLARCLVNRSPFASNALTLVHEVGGVQGEVMTFRNLAIVPLSVTNRLIGAILADNYFTQAPVGSEDLRSISAFGNLAALAIDRARLHAKTLAMVEVDGLTGVYNRRYYQKELQRILSLSYNTQQMTSIVVFDLDFFKGYNDRHGHLVGDQLLKDVARILRDNVRQSDKVARYGGEEFVLILPNTRPKAAVDVAIKLCHLVKEASLANGRVHGLTLSAGVAGTREKLTAEQLFERADRALYQAKNQGRDRVVVWTPEMAIRCDAEDASVWYPLQTNETINNGRVKHEVFTVKGLEGEGGT
jgi:diguanylate cyclase (GGDEF)-like protein